MSLYKVESVAYIVYHLPTKRGAVVESSGKRRSVMVQKGADLHLDLVCQSSNNG